MLFYTCCINDIDNQVIILEYFIKQSQKMAKKGGALGTSPKTSVLSLVFCVMCNLPKKCLSSQKITVIGMCQFFTRLMLFAVAALMASCSSEPGSLELSFQYNKQPGPGSNQYAVWIENVDGQVVKTLYVTEFTAKGRSRDGSKPARGYTYRTSCTPTWVQHVGAESLTDQQIDAFTGATPAQSGVQTFVWDFTDQSGQPVAKGTYRFYIEATYNGPSVVTYTGTVTYGAPAGDLPVETSYIEASEDRKDMIASVQARMIH